MWSVPQEGFVPGAVTWSDAQGKESYRSWREPTAVSLNGHAVKPPSKYLFTPTDLCCSQLWSENLLFAVTADADSFLIKMLYITK